MNGVFRRCVALDRQWSVSIIAVLVLALCALVSASARAGGPDIIRLEGEAKKFVLDGHLAAVAIKGDAGALGIADAAQLGSIEADTRRLTPGTRWYRFTVWRAPGTPADWMLAFGEPDIDDVRIFLPTADGGFSETQLGRRIPSRQLEVAARRPVAQLTFPEAVPVTVHIRLSSLSKIRFEDAALWRPRALIFDEARQSVIGGVNFGILAVIVAVYALFGFWLRDAVLIVYASFVATVLCQSSSHSGIIALLFPDAGRSVNYLLNDGGLIAGVAAFVLLWDRVLDLRQTFPILHKAYMATAVAMAVSLPMMAIPAFRGVIPLAQVLSLATSLSSLAAAAILVYRNSHNTLLKYYLIAFFPVAFVWIVQFTARLCPVVPPELGRDIQQYGTKAHIAILCIALAYRLSMSKHKQIYAEAALATERSSRQRLKTFIDMATHEFKTPLAVIDNTAQGLELMAPPERPEIIDRIGTIRRAVRRVVTLIETCLAAERETALHLQRIKPADLVRRVRERNLYPERSPLAVNADGLPETCRADGDLLGIALDALIDNARRYGPADQPVELAATKQDGSIVFTVQDRGPGVAPDEAERIFEKYYRCAASGAIPGSGIGLHLVRVIAELHGGRVHYQPRNGGGASFIMTIPIG